MGISRDKEEVFKHKQITERVVDGIDRYSYKETKSCVVTMYILGILTLPIGIGLLFLVFGYSVNLIVKEYEHKNRLFIKQHFK